MTKFTWCHSVSTCRSEQWLSFAGGLTKEVGDFSRGQSRKPLQAGDEKLGVFICYESIFPDEVRQFAKNGAQVFVNISNDGWYGDSGAYAQHLKQARMRAMENARWLLRTTNTGVTAAIDPDGRVEQTVPRKIRTVLQASYGLNDPHHVLHAPWRLAGISVCDNFNRSADYRSYSRQRQTLSMIQELEQEYSALQKKVHDLREYL